MINPNPSPTRSQAERHGFTLIELLVVISIIAVLAGLAFPAVNGAMESARRARALNDVNQISTAIFALHTEYALFPTNITKADSDFIKILTGATNSINSRKIVFLQVAPWKKGRGGINSNGDWCDPWDSNSVYQIALDTDYDNYVTAGTNSTNMMLTVAVWNVPTGTDTEKKRRYVTSW
jgi:prepilin-type N-terminal cleavage/methylation domain-containing protein